jgi:hypothetical protein
MIHMIDVRVFMIDMKFGAESNHWKRYLGASHTAKDVDEAERILDKCTAQLAIHAEIMEREGMGSTFKPSKKHPAWVVNIDEAQTLIMFKELNTKVHEVASKGRSQGVHIHFGTQYIDDSTLPMKTRSQFGLKIGHRQEAQTGSEQVFGSGSTKQGWCAHLLPGAPGWLQIKDLTGDKTFSRAYLVDDDDIPWIIESAIKAHGNTQAERYGDSGFVESAAEYVTAERVDRAELNEPLPETDDRDAQILDALAAGADQPQKIFEHTNIPVSTVSRRLTALRKRGSVERTAFGIYKIVANNHRNENAA